MPNVYPAKVNRTVHYRTEIAGVIRWRPAVITAVTDEDTCTIRVGHQDLVNNGTGNPPPDGVPDEVYVDVVRRSGNRGALNVNWNDRWRPG